MGFASAWLEKWALYPQLIAEAPDKNTSIIVVVPAFNEPGITCLLDSLADCDNPECKIELIIVVNAPFDISGDNKEANNLTVNSIESWKKVNKKSFFRLYYFIADTKSFPDWGVGLARKSGMDEALRRFSIIENPEGVILCLDADCKVEKNYFNSVCSELYNVKQRSACSVYFEHPVSGAEFPESVYNNIVLYELHLRYFIQGLSSTGFPWVFHTVGSAMAVKALPYMKSGGMNRKQAGEDFYFIQKHISSGKYFSLNTTTVFPSPRVSARAPFGTGASIGKLEETASISLKTYNPQSFSELKLLFDETENYYLSDSSRLREFYECLPPGLKSFITYDEWEGRISEINQNTSTVQSFRKRFFAWFNMFRIVKYMNHVHQNIFEKIPVAEAALYFLNEKRIIIDNADPVNLLLIFRNIEKNVSN
jgi:hypothetical protein